MRIGKRIRRAPVPLALLPTLAMVLEAAKLLRRELLLMGLRRGRARLVHERLALDRRAAGSSRHAVARPLGGGGGAGLGLLRDAGGLGGALHAAVRAALAAAQEADGADGDGDDDGEGDGDDGACNAEGGLLVHARRVAGVVGAADEAVAADGGDVLRGHAGLLLAADDGAGRVGAGGVGEAGRGGGRGVAGSGDGGVGGGGGVRSGVVHAGVGGGWEGGARAHKGLFGGRCEGRVVKVRGAPAGAAEIV